MKNKILSFFLFFALLIASSVSRAAPSGPPVPEVTSFDPTHGEVLKDGKYYVGILLSEDEYTFYTQLKIKYNLLDEQLQIWQDFGNSTKSLLDQNIANSNNILKDLKDLKKIATKESWWDSHKFEIGIVLGVLVTTTVVVAVEKLK